jgi:hypothetical protein
MTLRKKQKPQAHEPNYFMFAMPLSLNLGMDYIAMKLMFYDEPYLTATPIIVKCIEISEKAMKLFQILHEQSETPLSDARTKYSHNIEKLREYCSTKCEEFNDEKIKKLCQNLNDKPGQMFQFLRYGSHPTIDGFATNIKECVLVAEKIYLLSLMNLPANYLEMFNFSSVIFHVLFDTKFNSSKSRDHVLDAIKYNNELFDDYEESIKQYLKLEMMGDKIISFEDGKDQNFDINHSMQ